MPLERGEAGQDRDQQLALRRRGIAPRIVERFELGSLLSKGMQDIKQVAVPRASRSRRVTISKSPGSTTFEELIQLRSLGAVLVVPLDLFLVDLAATRGDQSQLCEAKVCPSVLTRAYP